MNKLIRSAALLTVLLLSAVGCAKHVEPQAPSSSYHGSEDFEKIKGLVGRWVSKPKGEKTTQVVTYKLTSGGNAVEEVLFPGTQHEMVSVYYVELGQLMMTHYCMLPNRPTLRASADGDKSLNFEFAGGGGINPAVDQHMHQLRVTFVDKNHLTQEWRSMKAGQLEAPKVMEWVRSKK